MKLTSLLRITLIGAILLTTACSNRDMQANNSGFLKDYDKLEENDKLEGTKVQIMPGADFSKYKNIYIAPVQIITQIPKKDWTPAQTKLFDEMSKYLTKGYQAAIVNAKVSYTLVEDKNTPDTLIFETAISAVEVHFDDMEWYQFTPITLGVTAIARATYVDAAVRILGESKLTDASTGKILARFIRLQKAKEVGTESDQLIFDDVKPALDAWIEKASQNVSKFKNGVIRYQKDK